MNLVETCRRVKLEKSLDKLCQTNPEVSGLKREMREHGWDGFFRDSETTQLAKFVNFEFKTNAMGYVWDVVGGIVDIYGIKSKEFEYVAKRLLSKKEKELIISNVGGNHATKNGLALIENRNYNIKKMLKLFEAAKRVYSELIKDEMGLAFIPFSEGKKKRVESNPLYGHYFSAN